MAWALLLVLSAACGTGAPGGSPISRPSPAAHAPAPIVIGLVAPLTGQLAPGGTQLADGARLAIHGPSTPDVEAHLVVADSGGTEAGVGRAVARLDRDHPTVLVGEVSSSLTRVLATLANDRGLPLVIPAATHPDLVGLGPGVVRLCVTDDVFGTALARFAREGLNVTRVAILRDATSDYSRVVGDAFTRDFVVGGGEIVAEASYRAGDADFAAPLEQIRSVSPDAVVMPGYVSDVAAIARQARARSITIPLLGTDSWDAPELLADAPTRNALEGSFFVTHWTAGADWPEARAFVRDWRTRHPRDPGPMAAFGHDAARLALDAAIEAGPDADRMAVRSALLAMRPRTGATGFFELLPSRESARTVTVVQITGGQAVYHSRLDPEARR